MTRPSYTICLLMLPPPQDDERFTCKVNKRAAYAMM